MGITLKEKYLLLALDDELGNREKGNYFFEIGFAACILHEMISHGIIEIRQGRIYQNYNSPSKDRIYLAVQKQFTKVRKAMKLKFWVSMVHQKSRIYRAMVLKDLVHKGILRKVEKRFLFFTYYRYPTQNPYPEQEFRQRLMASLQTKDKIERDDLALLTILEASKLLSVLFSDKQELKKARARIKDLTQANEFGAAVTHVMTEIQAAIVSTIVVTSAAT